MKKIMFNSSQRKLNFNYLLQINYSKQSRDIRVLYLMQHHVGREFVSLTTEKKDEKPSYNTIKWFKRQTPEHVSTAHMPGTFDFLRVTFI